MLELITAVALLCQVDAGGRLMDLNHVDQYQLKCQQRYLICLKLDKDVTIYPANALATCIMNRKL